jgi:hypothetical protein
MHLFLTIGIIEKSVIYSVGEIIAHKEILKVLHRVLELKLN